MLRSHHRRVVTRAAVLAVAAALGCDDDPAAPRVPAGFLEPDFALVDLNAYSPSHQATLSPRQHLGHVSAWYFGHAT